MTTADAARHGEPRLHALARRPHGRQRPGGSPATRMAAFLKFNVAFPALLGRVGAADRGDMQAFADFALALTPPPNPIRALDNSLTPAQHAGRNFYFTPDRRHPDLQRLPRARARRRLLRRGRARELRGRAPALQDSAAAQHVLEGRHVRHARGALLRAGDNRDTGDQIRGFGFLHDGSVDTLLRFFRATVFNFAGGDAERRAGRAVHVRHGQQPASPVVGQQVTLSGTNAGTVGGRDRPARGTRRGRRLRPGGEGRRRRHAARLAAPAGRALCRSDLAGAPAAERRDAARQAAAAGQELT